MNDLETRKQDWERVTSALLQAMPKDYQQLSSELSGLSHQFRQAMASRLESALNREAENRDRLGFGWRKKLAAWVNEEAAHLGLAILSPSAQCGSMLCAEPGRYREGKFYLQHRSAIAEGGFERTDSFESLPQLTLTPALLNQPQWDRWTWKVNARESQSQDRADR